MSEENNLSRRKRSIIEDDHDKEDRLNKRVEALRTREAEVKKEKGEILKFQVAVEMEKLELHDEIEREKNALENAKDEIRIKVDKRQKIYQNSKLQ